MSRSYPSPPSVGFLILAFVAVVSAFVILVAVMVRRAPAVGDPTREQKMVAELKYVRDSRTGLCFASFSPFTQYGAFSAVPCTPTVLHEIRKAYKPQLASVK